MVLIRICAVSLLVNAVGIPASTQRQSPKTPSTCPGSSGDLARLVQCSDKAAAEGRYEDAIEGFEAILKADKTDTTAYLRDQARTGLVGARIESRKKHERPLNVIWGAVSGFLMKYVIPILALICVLMLRILRNVYPRRGTVLSFSDLNAESGGASASSRSLTAELLFLLEVPEPVSVSGLHMNTMPGTGQPAFGVVRPAQAMTQAPDFSSSQHPVKLGSVEFGLGDAVQFISRFFGRPNERTLVGWLSCGERSAVAAAELTGRGYRRGHGPWRATAVGENAREEVLADIAAQILVDTGENRFTDSWQSLKACQDGIKIMRGADGGIFDSAKARRCFEDALEHDSANWIARFYLALSLCGEDGGKPATALRHFRILDEVLSRAARDDAFEDRVNVRLAKNWLSRFLLGLRARARAYFRGRRDRESRRRSPRLTGLLEHLLRYPECPFILQYNNAIALEELRRNSGVQELQSFLGEGVGLTDPLESLSMVAALRDPNSPWPGPYSRCARLLEERERLELSLYAQSERAHIISMRDAVGSVDVLRDIVKFVRSTCEDARCLDQRIDSWKALETTTAVALASLARALAARGNLLADQEGRNLLYEAIACEPHLVDAYLQLAKLYMRWREQFAKDWAGRAESLLTRADQMNPACGTIALLSDLHTVLADARGKLTSEMAATA
jgi:tetratricopeptide (TPR) repeat protein